MPIFECRKLLLPAMFLAAAMPISPGAVSAGGCPSLLAIEQASSEERPAVSIIGAVAEPGAYELEPGWRVSDLIDAAGGITDAGYPLGARLLRPAPGSYDAAALEARKLSPEAAASLLQFSMSSAASGCLTGIGSAPAARARFSTYPVAADPIARMQDPTADIHLGDGDVLVIPDRPGHVLVMGAVQMPGRMLFQVGATAADYIEKAGGWAGKAKVGQTRVLLPNGESRTLSVGLWNYKPEYVPPGSIIVVPGVGQSIADVLRTAVVDLFGRGRQDPTTSDEEAP